MLAVITLLLPALTASASLRKRTNYTSSGSVAAALAAEGPEGKDCLNKGPEWKEYCGSPKSESHESSAIDFSGVEQKGICSQYYQDRYLDAIFKAIGTTNTYFVEFGARRPEVLNSAHFRLNCGWSGLLMDGAPGDSAIGACPDCPGQELLKEPDDAPVRLRQAFITAENINDLFEQHKVPCEFDLLTVDVDRNDYWLVRALDFHRFRPRVVAVEFSSYFTKDEKKVISYIPDAGWHMWDTTGASLAALDELMQAKGYRLVGQVGGEHALWVLGSELHNQDEGMKVDTIKESWQWANRNDGKPAEGFEEVTPPCEGFGCDNDGPSCQDS